MKKIFTFAIMLFISMTFILTGCKKESKIVKFSFENVEEVATLNFDKEEYRVGDTLNFTLKLEDKFSNSNIKVYVNNELLNNVDGKYTYKILTENLTIKLDDYKLNTYTYNFTELDGFIFNTDVDIIDYGTDFEFTITNEKWENTFKVFANNVELISENGKYIVKNVTDNLNIEIRNNKLKTFNITSDLCTGSNLEFAPSFNNIVEYGKDLEFEVVVLKEYNSDNLKVYANNLLLTKDSNGKYVVKNITKDVVITTNGLVLKTFNITSDLCIGSNLEFAPTFNNTVEYGKDLEFEVLVSKEYNSDNLKVYANNVLLTKDSNGKYVIKNITKDVVITTNGLVLKTFNITKNLCTGVTISNNEDKVKYGSNFEFNVIINDGYVKGENFKVLVNNVELEPLNDKYIIFNVTNDIEISIQGVEIKTFNVKFTNKLLSGIDVLGNATVKYNENYSFSISLKEGYEFGKEFYIKVNNKNIYVANQLKYEIKNVTKNLDIEISDAVKKNFTVSVINNSLDEIVYDCVENVNYNEDVVLTLTIPNYIDKSNIVVTSNGINLPYNDYDIYTIKNVKENLTIEILGLDYKMFNISLDEEISLDIEIFPLEENIFTTNYINIYSFSIVLSEPFVMGENFAMHASNGVLTTVDGINWELSEVTDNVILTATGYYDPNDIIPEEIPGEGGSESQQIYTLVLPENNGDYKIEIANNKLEYKEGETIIIKLIPTNASDKFEIYINGNKLELVDTLIIEYVIKVDDPKEIVITVKKI